MSTKKPVAKKVTEKKPAEKPAAKFTKSQLTRSKRFADFRDLLESQLEDDKQYTIAQAQAVIDGFLKKKLKG